MRAALCVLFVATMWLVPGCTSESVRIALETQERANDIAQAVHEREHEGLRIYLFRDTVAQMKLAGKVNEEQIQILNKAWNNRDLMEFWEVQWERAKALRLVGVDAKLYADQSMLDLLWKSVDAKLQRVESAVAAEVGRVAAEKVVTTSPATQPATE